MHQQEPGIQCTNLTMGQKISFLSLVEVCEFHHGYASPDHHCPTTKHAVTGSITFSIASTDPFASVRWAQGEPTLICEKYRAPVLDLPILVLYANTNLAP